MSWDWNDLTAFQGWIFATIALCFAGLFIWYVGRSEAMPYLLILGAGWIAISAGLWILDRRL